MVAIAAAICFGAEVKNVFDPLKCVTALYVTAFAILPVVLDPPDLSEYSKSAVHDGQRYLLIYFCIFLVGYMLWHVLFSVKAKPHAAQPVQIKDRSGIGILLFAGLIFMIGLTCYLYAIVKSGGIGALVNFSGTRAHLLANVHGIFHKLSLFMAAGFALYAVTTIQKRPILVGIVAFALAALYSLFMGRALAFTPIMIFMVLYHYQVKRVKARYIAIGMVAGIVLLSVTATLRSAGKDRQAMLSNPTAFVKEFADIAGERVERTLLNYFEFLDTFMLVKKYVEDGEPLLKGHTMTAWFEPFDRNLFDDKLVDSVSAGNFVRTLKNPWFKGKAQGSWPSIPGELILNFGLLGAGLGMFIFGAIAQMISRFLRAGSCSLIAMAIHPYLLYIFVFCTFGGTYPLTNIVIFSAPLLFISFLIEKQTCQIEWLLPAPVAGVPMPVIFSRPELGNRLHG